MREEDEGAKASEVVGLTREKEMRRLIGAG